MPKCGKIHTIQKIFYFDDYVKIDNHGYNIITR